MLVKESLYLSGMLGIEGEAQDWLYLETSQWFTQDYVSLGGILESEIWAGGPGKLLSEGDI